MGRGRIAELCRLCEQLDRIFVVHKQDVVDATLVEQRKFVEGMRKLGCCVLGRTLEPFYALFWSLGQTQFAVELGDAQTVHGTGVEGGSRLAEEGDGLCRLTSAAPAVLAACTRAVGGVGMVVLGCENEERVCTVKVLLGLDGANAVGITVGEEVLGCGMPPIGETLQKRGGLAHEVFTLFQRLLDLEEVTWLVSWHWERL